MGLFNLLFKKKEMDTSSDTQEKDNVFEHILRVFFEFKDKFPDKIISILIYPSRSICEYVAFDITFLFDGKIAWYKSNETNNVLEFFELVEDDGHIQTFRCVHNTFEPTNNYDYVNKKIKACVRHFSEENPGRNFDLSKTGATITFW